MVASLRHYEGHPLPCTVTLKSSILRSVKPVVFMLACLPVMIFTINRYLIRDLSIDLGEGNCKWTESFPLPLDSDPLGTLVASYPGGGMRVTWQQLEGLTGIQVGDDYEYSGKRVGIIKTQWPHYEGIWSYGATLNQTILVVRNPRWAIPSFHNILSEVNYGQDFSEVYPYLNDLFTKRAPIANWIKWRDLKFEKEIELWAWHIDYYMEQGSKYWTDLDFDRVGEKPFHFLTDEEKPWPKDIHCINDIDCFPKALISYEKLRKHDTGPGELSKIANAVRDKKEMTVISDEAIGCVWFETFIHAKAPNNDNRDHHGNAKEAYHFTIDQMQIITNKLQFMKDKYSSGEWENNAVAQDLVLAFDDYIAEVGEELLYLQANPPPTPAPNAAYNDELVSWYETVGAGNRYARDKVRQMNGYWPLVANLYNETA
mmetsp:Transcript_9847/g.14502  ORF Transcript_9847/g.14502 Transcript_9847/m.14502 type:complete len:428 (+) Transcript_9847:80-1363(+)